jgi:hypothetical protein
LYPAAYCDVKYPSPRLLEAKITNASHRGKRLRRIPRTIYAGSTTAAKRA